MNSSYVVLAVISLRKSKSARKYVSLRISATESKWKAFISASWSMCVSRTRRAKVGSWPSFASWHSTQDIVYMIQELAAISNILLSTLAAGSISTTHAVGSSRPSGKETEEEADTWRCKLQLSRFTASTGLSSNPRPDGFAEARLCATKDLPTSASIIQGPEFSIPPASRCRARRHVGEIQGLLHTLIIRTKKIPRSLPTHPPSPTPLKAFGRDARGTLEEVYSNSSNFLIIKRRFAINMCWRIWPIAKQGNAESDTKYIANLAPSVQSVKVACNIMAPRQNMARHGAPAARFTVENV